MKQIILAFTAMCLFACNNTAKVKSATASKNTDLIQMNLRGNVQQIEETSYTVDSTGSQKMDSSINLSQFDEKGYINQYQVKDLKGAVTAEQTIKRAPNGATAEFTSMKKGKMVMKLVTELDKDGKYVGGKTYDSTGKQDGYWTDLKENEYGIVYAGKHWNMQSKPIETFDMKYNGPYFLGGAATDSTGKTSYTGTITLNDKNDPVEEVSTTREKDKMKTEKMTYKYDTYDDKGNWVQRTTYNEKGKPTKIVKRKFTYYKD